MKALRILPMPSLAAALLLLPGNMAVAQQNAARAAVPPATAAKVPHPPPSQTEVPVLPPLAKLSATRERPLFVRSRRPPIVAKPVEHHEPAKIVASDKLPAELVGIVMGPEQAYAILKNDDSHEFEHVHRGEKVEDWALDEIGPRYILLHRGGSKMRVELFDEKKDEKKDEAERQRTGGLAQRRPRRAFRPPPQVTNTPRRITQRRAGPQRARVRRPIPQRRGEN